MAGKKPLATVRLKWCAGIERENTGTVPGGVKNLEGDTDPVE